VQRSGCYALGQLVNSNEAAVVTSGALELVASAARRFGSDMKIQMDAKEVVNTVARARMTEAEAEAAASTMAAALLASFEAEEVAEQSRSEKSKKKKKKKKEKKKKEKNKKNDRGCGDSEQPPT